MTHQLILRAVEPDDADLLFDSENDEDAWGDSDIIAPLSRRLLREYAANYKADPFGEGQLRLMAVDSGSGLTVGVLDLYEIELLHRRAFVAIYVFPQFRRAGYALDMLKAASRYAGLRLGLEKLAARVLSTNSASISLFHSAGYRHCATLPEWYFCAGQPTDMHLFILNI